MKTLLRTGVLSAMLALMLVTAADAAIRGLRIKDGGTPIAEVVDGVVTGEVAVAHLETSPDLEVVFLDDVLAEVQPAARTLGVESGAPAVVTLASTGTWTFTATGVEEGSTTLTVRLMDGVTPEYTSPAIPLHCEEEHTEADGVILRQNGEVIATVWQGTVTGLIEVGHETVSDTITVSFLDVDSVEFVPDTAEGFALVLQMADSTIADPDPAGDWTFTIAGLIEGITSLRVGIFHIDHVDFLAQPIEVHVEEEHAEADGYVVRQNGLDLFSVWQGTATGFAAVPLGGATDSLDVVFIDVDSLEFVPETAAAFALVLQIGDTLVATQELVEDWRFRLHGDNAGSTTLRVGIYHVDHVDYLAVPVPVEVYAGASVDPAERAPVAFAGAAPNPFRAETRLRFALGAETDVDLALYDVSGRRVVSVLRARLPAGNHSAAFQAGDLAGGVYFARLVTSAGTYTKRIHLSR